MSSVRTLVIGASALFAFAASGAAPATAGWSTYLLPPSNPSFGIPSGPPARGQDFGIITLSPWATANIPGIGLNPAQSVGPSTPYGNFGIAMPSDGPKDGTSAHFIMGIGGNPFALGVSTPFGGFQAPGFNPQTGQAGPGGIATPSAASFGISGACNPFFPCGPIGPVGLGLNNNQSVAPSTPFGGFYGPGMGINMPCQIVQCGGHYNIGLNGAQTAGFAYPWMSGNGGGFGISSPWGGVSPYFGLAGPQGGTAQPQFIPVMVPYPVPMQGQGQGQPGTPGVLPTQCMINSVPALTKSVDDCEKAGGDVAASKTSAVQEAKK